MYGDFVWWQGVVEDRIDPLKLGRCRVRILGYHTDNKEEGRGIPTDYLPWATPSQPITSASMNGVGTTPMGPVEGTWVFGFFRDGKDAQEPVMTGTFGGIPETTSNPTRGFNDPNGIYPVSVYLNEPDTNRLARGSGALPVPLSTDEGKTSEDAPSLSYKRKTRTIGVPTALAGDISTTIGNTDDDEFYVFTPWNEPNPRYGGVANNPTEYLSSVELSSIYPHNHVRMSESGHVEEWDDTPSAERLHKFHRTGTFEEVQPDGTKVTKIVGSEYEITLKDKDVVIQGTCNVTIGGDCRMLYQGSLVQEVYGDYHLNVHGDRRTKILGNDVGEIHSNRKWVITDTCDLKVGENQLISITGDRTTKVLGSAKETISGNLDEIVMGTMATLVQQNASLVSAAAIDITSVGNLGLSTNSNFNHTVASNSTHTISGNASINVLGTFRKKIGGAAFEQYTSTLDERHEGHYKIFTGNNTSSVAVSGFTDFGCPSVRTGVTSCDPAASSGL